MRSFTYSICIFAFMFVASAALVPAQQREQAASGRCSETPAKDIADSVVMILTGKGSGLVDKVGSGVIVRSDGVILTAYHVVKDATQVQIRLKNGEIFDKVEMLGFDERRDIAALRISGMKLSAVLPALREPSAGDRIVVVSNPRELSWSVSDGVISSFRMSDEIPGANRGFRIVQFTAPSSPGSSGGLLANEDCEAVGIIIGSVTNGQNLNFAVPIDSVLGLANSSQASMTFGRGTSLELPQAVRPPVNADLVNADPKAIMQNAKFLYIDDNGSSHIKDKMMERALMKRPEFAKWKLVIVQDPKLADLEIAVSHDLFTWDYRYSIIDRRTKILLASSKVTAWDGNVASERFAKSIVETLGPGREPIKPINPSSESKK
ncbi:MAG: hypothetical protein DMF62_14405 [Acidobacteria bacterium]|nr:MAG: hypothetical protein DMF62_14405 [Acidobacteriota bacterium]